MQYCPHIKKGRSEYVRKPGSPRCGHPYCEGSKSENINHHHVLEVCPLSLGFRGKTEVKVDVPRNVMEKNDGSDQDLRGDSNLREPYKGESCGDEKEERAQNIWSMETTDDGDKIEGDNNGCRIYRERRERGAQKNVRRKCGVKEYRRKLFKGAENRTLFSEERYLVLKMVDEKKNTCAECEKFEALEKNSAGEKHDCHQCENAEPSSGHFPGLPLVVVGTEKVSLTEDAEGESDLKRVQEENCARNNNESEHFLDHEFSWHAGIVSSVFQR